MFIIILYHFKINYNTHEKLLNITRRLEQIKRIFSLNFDLDLSKAGFFFQCKCETAKCFFNRLSELISPEVKSEIDPTQRKCWSDLNKIDQVFYINILMILIWSRDRFSNIIIVKKLKKKKILFLKKFSSVHLAYESKRSDNIFQNRI